MSLAETVEGGWRGVNIRGCGFANTKRLGKSWKIESPGEGIDKHTRDFRSFTLRFSEYGGSIIDGELEFVQRRVDRATYLLQT